MITFCRLVPLQHLLNLPVDVADFSALFDVTGHGDDGCDSRRYLFRLWDTARRIGEVGNALVVRPGVNVCYRW
jgi:hypothetical protein